MNRKQLRSLISAGVFSAALLSGVAFAADAPVDPSMPMPAKTTDKDKPMDPSMPMPTGSKATTKPVKHHKKHTKAMDKDMPNHADAQK